LIIDGDCTIRVDTCNGCGNGLIFPLNTANKYLLGHDCIIGMVVIFENVEFGHAAIELILGLVEFCVSLSVADHWNGLIVVV